MCAESDNWFAPGGEAACEVTWSGGEADDWLGSSGPMVLQKAADTSRCRESETAAYGCARDLDGSEAW